MKLHMLRPFAPKEKRRSPHGERGLKWLLFSTIPSISGSLPARGAWIEIKQEVRGTKRTSVAPRTGSVD